MDNGYLEIKVEDDGIGMVRMGQVQMGHHYGLLGMQERARMIGAELSITSEPGNGTSVTVKVKL